MTFHWKLIFILLLLFILNDDDTSKFVNSFQLQTSDYNINNKNYYISINGVDNKGCGINFNSPCQNITYLFNNSIIDRRDNSTFYILPGLYNHSISLNFTGYNGINLIGVQGKEKTIITTKRGVRAILSIDSNLMIQGISFLDCLIYRNEKPPYIPYGLLSDQRYSDYLTYLYFSGGGGAIQIIYGKLWVQDCLFKSNRGRNGGALFSVACNATIIHTVFETNVATIFHDKGGSGGAVLLGPATVTDIFNCIFKSNKADNGGAIIQTNGKLFIKDTIFVYNIASNGGVSLIYNHSLLATERCTFMYNHANISGVFNMQDGVMIHKDSIFQSNTAISVGGVITMTGYSSSYIVNSKFIDNYAPSSSILENYGLRSAIFFGCEFSWFVNPSRKFGIMQSIFSISNYNFLFVKDSIVNNSTGNVIWCTTSNSIIALINTTFTNISSKVVNIHSRGYVFSFNCRFINNNAPDYLFVLRNGAGGYMYKNIFENNQASALAFLTFNSTLIIIESQFNCNTCQKELINAFKGCTLDINNSYFKNNIGTTRGGVIRTDQWGQIKSSNNYYINNTSIHGSVFYFVKNVKLWGNYPPNYFINDTYVNNTAKVSGSVVYYKSEIYGEKFNCQNCLFKNNQALYGNEMNSGSFTFLVLQMERVVTNVQFPVLIYAYDQFNNLVLGRNDITFKVGSCENLHLTGVKSSVIQSGGVTTLYNLKVNSQAGETCEIAYYSEPSQPEPIKKSIEISQCSDGEQVFEISSSLNFGHTHGNGLEYECLKIEKISGTAKTIMISISSILLVIIFICLIITLIYRNEKVINFGNLVFLFSMLAACVLLCIVIFVSIDITSFSCHFSIIILPLGYGTLFTLVLLKQIKIYKLFKYSDFLKINTDNLKMLKYGGVVLLPIVVLVVIGLIIYPSKPKYVLDLRLKTATQFCKSKNFDAISIVIITYEILILLSSCIIAMKSKRYHSTPGTFYESLFNSILIYNYFLIMCVLTPLIYTLDGNPTTTFLIYSIGSSVIIFTTLTIIYIPKFNYLIRHKKIVSSLRKVIQAQEKDIQRNKDLIVFYKMFLMDKSNINNPIFHIHETFSSEDDSDYSDEFDEEDEIGKSINSLFKNWENNYNINNNNNSTPSTSTSNPSSCSLYDLNLPIPNCNKIIDRQHLHPSTPTLIERAQYKNKRKRRKRKQLQSKSTDNSPNLYNNNTNLRRRNSSSSSNNNNDDES